MLCHCVNLCRVDAPAGLEPLVAQMRSLGVSRLRTSDYEIELGPVPAPQHPAEQVKVESEAERQKRLKFELDDLLFASSESGTPLTAPSLGGHA